MMDSRLRRLLVATAAAATLFTVYTAQAKMPLSALVLQRSDVPNSYRMVQAGALTNAAIEAQRSLTAAQIRSYGRVDGYDSQYSRATKAGVFNLGSEVVLFKTASGNRGYYHLVVNQDLRQLQALKTVRHSSVTGLGDENIVITYTSRSSPSAPFYTTTLVAVRRGIYLEYLSTVDPAKQANPQLAVTLMRKMDARVRRAK